MENPRNPFPTADIIIEHESGGIILIERLNEPHGWAIPGGFIDYGESADDAAVREAKEETSLDVELTELFGVYSNPNRDPRFHTLTMVYLAKAGGEPKADDDAKDIGLFTEQDLPQPLVFDHADILAQYFEYRRSGRRPAPCPTK
jgi:ADP-ribose pyrophosphatase YjhB (NUDIX family)